MNMMTPDEERMDLLLHCGFGRPRFDAFIKKAEVKGDRMGRLEVQGIVSAADGVPRVQLRQLDDDGVVESEMQFEVIEARDVAHNILEATFNAVYDAALVSWAKEVEPKKGEEFASQLLVMIRTHRSDHWGLPNSPEDWRPEEER